VGQRLGSNRGQFVDPVEHFTDDVEAGGQVRTADAHVDTDGLANVGAQGHVAQQRLSRAIEDQEVRVLVEHRVHIKVKVALVATITRRVDLALHNVELAVDRGQPTLGLHYDQTVHTVRDVVRYHR